jgi:hypothetical protein
VTRLKNLLPLIMLRLSLVVLLALAPVIGFDGAPSRHGRDYFASPAGTANGTGSGSDPWDLATALATPAVRPGDRIWLAGGVYGDGRTIFTSTLVGTSERPIIVRERAGERATINGGLAVRGPYVWFWGFEITNFVPRRDTTRAVPEGVDTYAGSTGVKFINLIVHDTTQGFGLWEPAEGAEVDGCLIYYNGFQGPDRGHGHGIYTQNALGTKRLLDNIIFSQFGNGIQAYGSGKANVRGYEVAGNIVFNNGALSKDARRVDNILFAGGPSLSDIRVTDNFTYASPGPDSGYSRLGWTFGTLVNQNITVTGNYWMGGETGLEFWNWQQAEFSGNSIYAPKGLILLLGGDQALVRRYAWDNNRYYGSGLFRLGAKNSGFAEWKAASGLDAHSEFSAGRPHGVWTFLRPNRYEPGRAHIVVYNWDGRASVPIELGRLLHKGQRFAVRDAQNFFGPAVVSGVYTGAPVALPLTNRAVASAVGDVPTVPEHTSAEFAVFVLVPGE